jgi:class 3 adenylate cyclase
MKQELDEEVAGIFRAKWDIVNGRVIPGEESIQLGNDAVRIDATVLYADLADSTKLVDNYLPEFASEIYKTFLTCCARIIRARGGTITAYDGDRVMAVFMGDDKNRAAVRTALNINYARHYVLIPALQKQYPTGSYSPAHVVGVDTSSLLVSKIGIRNYNDLVWVGRAANHAAKLAALDESYSTYISEEVFNDLTDLELLGHPTPANMWEPYWWDSMSKVVLRSSYWWQFT